MSDKPKPQQTRLRITACSAVYHGEHANGQTYKVHEIEAEKLDGTPVGENLRSFESLPVGEEVDLNVVKFNHSTYGLSYTLSRRGGSTSAAKIKALEEQLRDMASRLAIVENALAGSAFGNPIQGEAV